jgi:hypothetical protein
MMRTCMIEGGGGWGYYLGVSWWRFFWYWSEQKEQGYKALEPYHLSSIV